MIWYVNLLVVSILLKKEVLLILKEAILLIITIKENNYLIFNGSDKEKTINILKECYEKDLYNSHDLIDVSKNTDKEMVINHFIKEKILEKEYDYFD